MMSLAAVSLSMAAPAAPLPDPAATARSAADPAGDRAVRVTLPARLARAWAGRRLGLPL